MGTEISAIPVNDHGLLGGLADNDHAQYATDTDLTTHEAAADPHTGYQKESEKGAASGYASLDASSVVVEQPAAHATRHELSGADELHAQESDDLLQSADTERTHNTGSYLKVKDITIGNPGTYRIKFDLKVSDGLQTAQARIFRNGVAVGAVRTTQSTTYVTFSEDVSGWSRGDACELNILVTGGVIVSAQNFRLYAHVLETPTVVTD